MKLKECDICKRSITICNFERHYKACKGPKLILKQIDDKFECPHCYKLYNKYGIKNHIWKNHTKEGQEFVNTKRVAWNKDLTKENDIRVKKYSDSFKENYKKGFHKKRENPNNETKTKISNTIKEKVKNGNWHFSFSKVRTYDYKGIKLYGKWELQYAKYLDENNIKWTRPKKTFEYIFLNKKSYYLPDFYLIETDEYIEIKGYETDKDRAKWFYFPHKLTVLKRDELFKLKIITLEQFKGKE